MNSATFRELLRANPFQPFRIVMASGEKFDIRKPDAAFLTQSSIQVGVDIGNDGIPENFRICSYLNVKEVQRLN